MLIYYILLCIVLVRLTESDGLADKVYKTIHVEEGSACYRLFNGTHQYGCHATDSNQNGLVVEVTQDKDLTGLKSCFRSTYENYDGSYWILMPLEMLKRETIEFFQKSNCTAGLLLYTQKNIVEHVSDSLKTSHDSSCPNEMSDFYYSSGKREYCSNGINSEASVAREGLLNIDWRVQMVYLQTDEELEVVRQCYNLFNKATNVSSLVQYPFCGMSFRLVNSAAGNSEICFRRGKESAKLFQLNVDGSGMTPLCSPLAGRNLFAWPTPILQSANLTTEPKYMVIGAKMDSFGVIPEVSPGEVSVITSLISVIVAARSMGTSLDKWTKASLSSKKHIFFAAFNGESFDYIGSSAVVHKMRNGIFPLEEMNIPHLRPVRLDQVEYIIEAQQIGSTKDRKLHAHIDGERYSKNKKDADVLLESIGKNLKSHNFEFEKPSADSRVPPASWHSFAKFDENVQSLLIAPFGKKYEYNRFNSILDRNQRSSAEKKKAIDEIVAVASSILSAAATYVKVENVTEVAKVDVELATTLFDCLVLSNNWYDCDFMKKLNGERFSPYSGSYSMHKKSTYVSVLSTNPYQEVVHWLFIFALGSDKETLNVDDKNSCMHLTEHQAVYSYSWQPNPYTGKFSCLRSSTQFITLMSPAFMEGNFMNSTYSTWTESVYAVDSVRLFLLEDTSFDWTVLLAAIFSALLSIFIVGRCSESTFIVDEGEPAAEGGEPL